MATLTSCSFGEYKALSRKFDCVEEVKFGEYDVVILSESWDPRSKTICDSQNIIAHNGMLLRFSGVLAKEFGEVEGYLESLCKEHVSIFLDGDSHLSFCSQVINRLITARSDKGGPLHVLFDISAVPRPIYMLVLACVLRNGICKKVEFLYNEGFYPDAKNGVVAKEVAFTSRSWEVSAIPYLQGEINPGWKTRLTVAVGFEGAKTLMAIGEFEPDCIRVIMPNPGYSIDYVDRVRLANDGLFREYAISGGDEICSNAGDAIDVWSKLVFCSGRERGWNDYFLCVGSKPHGLGLCLAALSLGYPTMLYSLPDGDNVVDIVPKRECWLYTVENLIVPT